MNDFTIDYTFSLEDFKRVEEIEKDYFEEENISSAEEVMKWYEKNNKTSIGVRNSEGTIIASINILPLKKNIYDDIYNNRINEADIIYEDIEEFKDDMECFLYLSSISIDKNYKNNYILLSTLIKVTIDLLEELLERNIKIKEVLADAGTIYGRKICEKILNMNFVTDTFHGTKIYNIEGKEFLEILRNIENKMNKR